MLTYDLIGRIIVAQPVDESRDPAAFICCSIRGGDLYVISTGGGPASCARRLPTTGVGAYEVLGCYDNDEVIEYVMATLRDALDSQTTWAEHVYLEMRASLHVLADLLEYKRRDRRTRADRIPVARRFFKRPRLVA